MSQDLTVQLIEHLQGLNKCGEYVTGTNHNKVLVPENMKLESIELMNRYRNRFRGSMDTTSITSFADYVSEFHNVDKPSSCFVRSLEPIAKVIFDIGDIEKPEHCLHTATLKLAQTADYDRVLKTNGDSMKQASLAEFMEDYAHCLTAVDADGKTMEMTKAIPAVRNLTIDLTQKSEHQVQQLSTSMSALETIAATSKGDPLPAWLKFNCAPYLGLMPREFPMRISIGQDRHEGMRLKLSIANLEGIQEAIQDEFKGLVSEKMPDEINTYIGAFSS